MSLNEGKDRPGGSARLTDITPETKVGALLDRFPELEDVFLSMSPHFAKLKNPVLRKTVAKVATLRQVAQLGNVPLADLINRLRTAVGLGEDSFGEGEGDAGAGSLSAVPNWFSAGAVVKSLDARPLISSGVHPVGQVMKDLALLGEGEIYELVTPFLPAPLIDTAKGKGYRSWSTKEASGLVKTYFTRQSSEERGQSE